MNNEPEIEYSHLSGAISSGGKMLDVQIYRSEGEARWLLEIEDEFGNSTVWDETFETEEKAMTEAKKSILEETAGAFVGPEDGKSKDDWR